MTILPIIAPYTKMLTCMKKHPIPYYTMYGAISKKAERGREGEVRD